MLTTNIFVNRHEKYIRFIIEQETFVRISRRAQASHYELTMVECTMLPGLLVPGDISVRGLLHNLKPVR